MPTSPKALVCMDCRTTFEYTAEEQGYFASRGYRAAGWPAPRPPKKP